MRLVLLLAIHALARLEQLALVTVRGTVVLLAAAVALLAAMRAANAWQRRTRVPVDLDELPAAPTQSLGLSD